MKKLFVIDGYGQIYRSYYAMMTNPLRDREGNNVSAVYGFFNTFIMLVKKYKPDYITVAMDSIGKTFRHGLYEPYKANRAKTPEDLHSQIPVIKNILSSMGVKYFEMQGMEADDIIATLAKQAESMSLETVMVTGDKDLMQLVRPAVCALRPPRKGEHEYKLCKEEEVKEIFGVRPDQITDYLTILGDSSDNVPGIDGIGEKGAVKLLNDYDTLDAVYENLPLLSAGLAKKLENARNHIELSKTLILLKDDLFEYSAEDFKSLDTSAIDWNAAKKAFESINSMSLASAAAKMILPGSSFVADENSLSSDAVFLESSDAVKSVFATNAGKTVFLCFDDKSISFGFDDKTSYRTEKNAVMQDSLTFCVAGRKVVVHDAKTLDKFVDLSGCEIISDTYLSSWLIETSGSLLNLPACLSAEVAKTYSANEKKLSDAGLTGVMYEMEMPLLHVLSSMEKNGIKIDSSVLQNNGKILDYECRSVEKSIYEECGQTFNVNSPKQLQDVLFGILGLPPVKKTKNGYSTDSDVLQELSVITSSPVPELLLRYRLLSKLLSTYVNALEDQIKDGRIMTTFLQTGTATGRLSSKNPNLQNIPVRSEEGRKIRDAFVPSDGCVLLSADYSQIELVVLAHMSKDSNLCNAFAAGEDIHRTTASAVFDVMPALVTDSQRRMAKVINFGIIYGMSAYSLSRDLGITPKEAKAFIDKYFEKYSTVRSFINETLSKAEHDGYVYTMAGHRRNCPDMQSSNKVVRAAASRAAFNTVIQGSAAEIIKMAMINIYRKMQQSGLSSKMILQVHDELIFDVPVAELETMKTLVKYEMENAVKLSVPLRVSMESASRWGDIH